MKIGIVSTQNNGKTTLVNKIKAKWPLYVSPEKTYRDIVSEKNLPINRDSDMESQGSIREALFVQAHVCADSPFSVQDRTSLDNLVYTLYLVDKGKIDDEVFITETIEMTREAMRKYDIIFWMPLNKSIKMNQEDNHHRDLDEQFRIEIDNIFQGVFEIYKQNQGLLFDPKDQPAMIVLEGDLEDKLETVGNYIAEDGNLVAESSVLATMEDEFDQMQLMKEVANG